MYIILVSRNTGGSEVVEKINGCEYVWNDNWRSFNINNFGLHIKPVMDFTWIYTGFIYTCFGHNSQDFKDRITKKLQNRGFQSSTCLGTPWISCKLYNFILLEIRVYIYRLYNHYRTRGSEKPPYTEYKGDGQKVRCYPKCTRFGRVDVDAKVVPRLASFYSANICK